MELDADAVKRDVARALREDVGCGDINAALIAADLTLRARVITRDAGIFCGQPWATAACQQVDATITLNWQVADGNRLTPGTEYWNWKARRFVDAVAGTKAVVLDTRKTLPGLRAAQKYAVRVGGARNHRMGLFDAYLLKENHIAAAGGITPAVAAARSRHPAKPVQVEVERNEQLREAIAAGASRVLLDNYAPEALREAVAIAAGAVALEASGGITLENVAAVAATGVDYISVGAITKHVAPLDMSMRIVGVAG